MANKDGYPRTFDGVDDFVGNIVAYVTEKVTAASGGTAEWETVTDTSR